MTAVRRAPAYERRAARAAVIGACPAEQLRGAEPEQRAVDAA